MIWQTDFDGDHHDDKMDESVEWVKVNGKEIKTNIRPDPGRNPCKEVYEGKAQPSPQNETETGIIFDDLKIDLAGRDGEQAAMMWAPVPGQPGKHHSFLNCRRRHWLKPSKANSLLKQSDSLDAHRRRGNAPFTDYKHARAYPDEMVELLREDITEELGDAEKIELEGKISKFVDECGKDGYLLNADAKIECE
jgi:hypothetical protein